MKKILNSKSNTLYSYTFLMLSLELIFKALMFHEISFINILYTFIFSMPIIMLLSLITNLFREKISKIIFYISIFLITFLYLFQYVFYRLFSVTFSFNTLGLANQAADFTNIIFEAIKNYFFPILLLSTPLIIIMLLKRTIRFYKLIRPVRITGLVVFLILVLLTFIAMQPGKEKLYSAHSLYYKVNAPEKTIEK